MIDAIRPVYSSIHESRNQNSTNSQPFARSVRGAGDVLELSKIARKASNGKQLGATLAVGGCIGAGCLILSLLAALSQPSADLKNIPRAAIVVGGVGVAIFGIFKALERLILKA